MIKVGICDDEKEFWDIIGEMLRFYFEEKGIDYQQKEYESGKAFMKEKDETDILLLDIEMKGISGIQLKDWLQGEVEDVKIIFVTNHSEEMPEAFGKNVYGFLKKPVKQAQLAKYLNRILEDMEENQNLVIKSLNRDIVVKIKNIFYFVSEKKYSQMVSKSGKYFCDMSLYQLEEMLKHKSFFRCHKSYLVNLGNIHRIEESIFMENGDKIPVSRRKIKDLKDLYREYIIRKAR